MTKGAFGVCLSQTLILEVLPQTFPKENLPTSKNQANNKHVLPKWKMTQLPPAHSRLWNYMAAQGISEVAFCLANFTVYIWVLQLACRFIYKDKKMQLNVSRNRKLTFNVLCLVMFWVLHILDTTINLPVHYAFFHWKTQYTVTPLHSGNLHNYW